METIADTLAFCRKQREAYRRAPTYFGMTKLETIDCKLVACRNRLKWAKVHTRRVCT